MKHTIVFPLCLLTALASLSGSAFAQSKEQREAAKQYPFTLRVNAGQDDSKITKGKGKGGRSSRTQVKTTEKTKHWTAQISSPSTNVTAKVELKAFYIGTSDNKFAIIGSDKFPVAFNEKGRATVEITSPTAKLVKTTKQKGGRRNPKTEKIVTGERINGVVVQLIAEGTIVKTFVTQSTWAKGAWSDHLSEEDLKPNGKK